MDDEQDPSLQAPQEANTTKHINFAELEDTGDDTSNNSSNNDDDDDSPTKKAWQELREDEQKNKIKDE
jgi:hypothetical protein